MPSRFRVSLLLVAAFATAGCSATRISPGSSGGFGAHGSPASSAAVLAQPSAEPSGGTLNVAVLGGSGADFDPAPSPEALAAKRPIVAAGVVDGWQQGPILDTYPRGPLDYRVLMRVRITHPLKGVTSTASLRGGVVFIEFDQGAVLRDESAPASGWKPVKSVADFEKGIPRGTRVLVFPRERPPYEQNVHASGDPLPDGATIMSIPPQGLVLEDPGLVARGAVRTLIGGREPLRGGSRAAWLEPRNMDEMIERLRLHGFTEAVVDARESALGMPGRRLMSDRG